MGMLSQVLGYLVRNAREVFGSEVIGVAENNVRGVYSPMKEYRWSMPEGSDCGTVKQLG